MPTASPQPSSQTSSRLVVTDLGKGIGPVKTLELGPLDPTLAQQGKKLYVSHCATCHQFKSKLIGPALAKVTQRRQPEWIMNMILNPVEMTQKDPQAKELADKMMLQMADLKIQPQQARAILEFFREHDAKE